VLWVSRWQATTPDGSRYEGIGLAPDVPESISEQDLADERDPILERAIELLSN
jgi:C-terminal processing protease CtpA/Prc